MKLNIYTFTHFNYTFIHINNLIFIQSSLKKKLAFKCLKKRPLSEPGLRLRSRRRRGGPTEARDRFGKVRRFRRPGGGLTRMPLALEHFPTARHAPQSRDPQPPVPPESRSTLLAQSHASHTSPLPSDRSPTSALHAPGSQGFNSSSHSAQQALDAHATQVPLQLPEVGVFLGCMLSEMAQAMARFSGGAT
jgi:hypothetical protein